MPVNSIECWETFFKNDNAALLTERLFRENRAAMDSVLHPKTINKTIEGMGLGVMIDPEENGSFTSGTFLDNPERLLK